MSQNVAPVREEGKYPGNEERGWEKKGNLTEKQICREFGDIE